MFDTIEERIKHDEGETSTARERYLRYAAALLLSLMLFGSLYLGVQYFE